MSRSAQKLVYPGFGLHSVGCLHSNALYVLHVRKSPVLTVYGPWQKQNKNSLHIPHCRCDTFYCHGLVTTANLMQLTSISQMESTGLDCTEWNIIGIRKGKADISFWRHLMCGIFLVLELATKPSTATLLRMMMSWNWGMVTLSMSWRNVTMAGLWVSATLAVSRAFWDADEKFCRTSGSCFHL